MSKIISFIIPSYNAEPYLNKCLNSFLTEDETQEKIEVLIVNDGSTDRTPIIAREYAEKYPSVYCVVDKENGGHGSTINVGSRLATGKYIKVIDADDWIITENLHHFIDELEKCNADVVLNPYHQVDMHTGQKSSWPLYCTRYYQNITFEEVVRNMCEYENCLTFHGITYRREFYNQCRHELPEKIFYEDQEYSAIPCCQAEWIYPMDIYLYQYLIGNANQSVAVENLLKRLSHQEKVIENIILYRKQHTELSTERKAFLDRRIDSMIMSYYKVICIMQNDKKAGRESMHRFNQNMQMLDEEVCVRISRKRKLFLLMNYLHVSEKIYQKILAGKLYHIIRKKHK